MRKPILVLARALLALVAGAGDPRAEHARAAARESRRGLRRLPQRRALDPGHEAVEVPRTSRRGSGSRGPTARRPAAPATRSLVFNHVGTSCADCHKDAHRGELGAQCESCHLPASWTNQTQMLQVHNRTRLPLFATHARLDCAACHGSQRPYQYATTPAECGNCHLSTYLATTNPSHASAGFSRRCEDCHSVTAPTWSSSAFSHPASFPLAGGHARHRLLALSRRRQAARDRGVVRLLPRARRSRRRRTPATPRAAFPRTCEDCHTIVSWRPAKFDHSRDPLPADGRAHAGAVRELPRGRRLQGHRDGLQLLPSDGLRAHDEPEPPGGRASRPGARTATTPAAWKPANFDHSKTRFALTGAHERTDCARCHVGGRYTGTPTDCNSCHQPDYARTTNPNHEAGGFPITCQTCHGTNVVAAGELRPQPHALPADGRAHASRCAQLPRGRRATPAPPTDCNSCHQPDYPGTTNPNHQAAGFPVTCESCHSTTAWRPGEHRPQPHALPADGGAHARRLRAAATWAGATPARRRPATPATTRPTWRTTNPNHEAARLPAAPARAATARPRGGPASFDHSRTRFPLTGAHTRVACAQLPRGRALHRDADGLQLLPRRGLRGDRRTRTTRPRGFPITLRRAATPRARGGRRASTTTGATSRSTPESTAASGRAARSATSAPGNYKAFECILCHEHSNRTKVDADHRGEPATPTRARPATAAIREGRPTSAGAATAVREQPMPQPRARRCSVALAFSVARRRERLRAWS